MSEYRETFDFLLSLLNPMRYLPSPTVSGVFILFNYYYFFFTIQTQQQFKCQKKKNKNKTTLEKNKNRAKKKYKMSQLPKLSAAEIFTVRVTWAAAFPEKTKKKNDQT